MREFISYRDIFSNPRLTCVKILTRGSKTNHPPLCNCNILGNIEIFADPISHSVQRNILWETENFQIFFSDSGIFYVKTHRKCVSKLKCCQFFTKIIFKTFLAHNQHFYTFQNFMKIFLCNFRIFVDPPLPV